MSIGYEPGRLELDVEFRERGDVYRYFQVAVHGSEGRERGSFPERPLLPL